jgi:hypothetical protein
LTFSIGVQCFFQASQKSLGSRLFAPIKIWEK